MKDKLTNHHIIPKSYGGNRYFHNSLLLKEVKHRALHTLFDNKLPDEQLVEIVDLSGKALKKKFADEIMSVINDYSLEKPTVSCFGKEYQERKKQQKEFEILRKYYTK